MDPTIPVGAALLLDFVYATDAGKPVPACYQVIFGNRQKYLSKPITSMTLGEVIDAQKNWSNRAWVRKNWDKGAKAASSAAGAAQFMRDTLIGLAKDLKLSGNQPFDEDFQDRLAYHLLKRRGYPDFIAGKISMTEFGKRLAMEWASFPVLAPCKGAHGNLKRGQGYYDGDGLNSALTTPEKVEQVLMLVKNAPDASPVPAEAPKPVPAPVEAPKAQPAPVPQLPPTKTMAVGGWLVLILAGLAVWWDHLTAWLASHWPF